MECQVGSFKRYKDILSLCANQAIGLNADLQLEGWTVSRDPAGIRIISNTDPAPGTLFTFDVPVAVWNANIVKTVEWLPLYLRAVSQYAVFSLINYVIQMQLKEDKTAMGTLCQTALTLVQARLSMDGSALTNTLLAAPERSTYLTETATVMQNLSTTLNATVAYDPVLNQLSITIIGSVYQISFENVATDQDIAIVNSNIIAAMWAAAVPATAVNGTRLLTELDALVGAYTTGIGKPRTGKRKAKKKPNPVPCGQKAMIRGGANSCYFDTALVSLFHWDSEFVNTSILDYAVRPTDTDRIVLQNELRRVKTAIVNGTDFQDVDTLRQLVSNLYTKLKLKPAVEWMTDQHSPCDLNRFLQTVFNTPHTTTTRTSKFFALHDDAIPDEDKVWYPHGDPVEIVIGSGDELSPYDLMRLAGTPRGVVLLEDFITDYVDYAVLTDNNREFVSAAAAASPANEFGLNRVQRHRQIFSAPWLLIVVNRTYQVVQTEIKTFIRVVPPETIKLPGNADILRLVSINQHIGASPLGGHYFCYFLCEGSWYKYNDSNYNNARKVPVGDFAALVTRTLPANNPGTTDTLFENATEFYYM